MKELRLVSGYDILYGNIKAFIQEQLFDQSVELKNPNTLRNLSELAANKTIIQTFKKEINSLTINEKSDAEIRDVINSPYAKRVAFGLKRKLPRLKRYRILIRNMRDTIIHVGKLPVLTS
jgi:hypothetical protein